MVRIKDVLFLFLVAGLYACGSSGGGSSGGSSTPTTIPTTTPTTTPTEKPDPLFVDQWHLKNTGQAGNDGLPGKAGEDINVVPAWNRCGSEATCRGEGIRIAVVDDGLEIKHEDLAANIVGKGFNYLDNTTDPTPLDGKDSHGTSVAGLIAARDLNGLGGRGVAPRANLVGYNYLQSNTLVDELDAMTRDAANIHISNNSWGPGGGAGTLKPSDQSWRIAIESGQKFGRGGLGTIYLFAGGNDGAGDENCPICVNNSNYDGTSNFHRVIAVAALDDKGKQTTYSEKGANLLISAPGGEFCGIHGITTTDLTGDRGQNPPASLLFAPNDYFLDLNYTRCFAGTSAATPIVSGVVALVLQANLNLGFRDVRAILARSARKNDPTDPDWTTNGAGLHVNHKYGFGAVDADAAVQLAKSWTNLGPEKESNPLLISVNEPILDNPNPPITSQAPISGTGINNIESIEVLLNVRHSFAGDLEVTLINVTTGTHSVLAETHHCSLVEVDGKIFSQCRDYDHWIFSTTRHMGEAADGLWRIEVKDGSDLITGTFQSWAIAFYGT